MSNEIVICVPAHRDWDNEIVNGIIAVMLRETTGMRMFMNVDTAGTFINCCYEHPLSSAVLHSKLERFMKDGISITVK